MGLLIGPEGFVGLVEVGGCCLGRIGLAASDRRGGEEPDERARAADFFAGIQCQAQLCAYLPLVMQAAVTQITRPASGWWRVHI